jgi:hypothetical protein
LNDPEYTEKPWWRDNLTMEDGTLEKAEREGYSPYEGQIYAKSDVLFKWICFKQIESAEMDVSVDFAGKPHV